MFFCNLNQLSQLTSCKELHNSCKKYGYFFIQGFDTEYFNLQDIFSEATNFFTLPTNEKQRNTAQSFNQYLGYRGIGTEKSVMTGYPELCEQYKFGYFYDKENNSSSFALNYLLSYENIFKKYSKLYFDVMEQLAAKILKVIANNFNLGEEYFQQFCNQPMHQLGLNYYPTSTLNEDTNHAMSAHKDLCLFAIIAQNKEGLMVQDLCGEWKLIPYMPNTLLVLLGDYLERWTNGYYLAPVHQVLESSEVARMSLIYKHRPNYETVIPIIPGINPERNRDDVSAIFHTGKAYENKINNIMSINIEEVKTN